ncbi:MAG: EpsG family protein [Prevotella sp.]|nr:EpsG family protein [Prevotella sp.]
MNLYDFSIYYHDIYEYVIIYLTILYAIRIWDCRYPLIVSKIIPYEVIILCLALILFLGLRPIHPVFQDTMGYARRFEYFQTVPFYHLIEAEKDTGFAYFSFLCSRYISTDTYFLLCEFIYFIPLMIASIFVNKRSYPIIMVAFISTFSFYAGCVNIIRMGIASSLSILAFILILKNEGKKHIIIAVALFYFGFKTQGAIALPILCFIVSYFYFYKHPKITFFFWLASILFSLVNHTFFENLFISVGFDQRLEDAIDSQYNEFAYDAFAYSGFRWDFLIISSISIIWSWYLIFKRKIQDKSFIVLACTYILANAFWILVIRARFSDRFARLSWYLYPLVLIYPLLNYKIWKYNQKYYTIFLFSLHTLITILLSIYRSY